MLLSLPGRRVLRLKRRQSSHSPISRQRPMFCTTTNHRTSVMPHAASTSGGSNEPTGGGDEDDDEDSVS